LESPYNPNIPPLLSLPTNLASFELNEGCLPSLFSSFFVVGIKIVPLFFLTVFLSLSFDHPGHPTLIFKHSLCQPVMTVFSLLSTTVSGRYEKFFFPPFPLVSCRRFSLVLVTDSPFRDLSYLIIGDELSSSCGSFLPLFFSSPLGVDDFCTYFICCSFQPQSSEVLCNHAPSFYRASSIMRPATFFSLFLAFLRNFPYNQSLFSRSTP